MYVCICYIFLNEQTYYILIELKKSKTKQSLLFQHLFLILNLSIFS